MKSESPLPRYEKPPVEEVALGVYFDRLDGLRATMLGEVAALWRGSYPEISEQPERPPVPPELPAGAWPMPALQVQLSQFPPLPRCCFASSDGCRVIQLQRDCLVHNWRNSAEQAYPHYKELVPDFAEAYTALESFAEERGIGSVHPTQCEVTYVNPVPLEDLGPEKDLSRLLEPWSGQTTDTFLPAPEAFQLALSYPIHMAGGEFAGRLHITAASTSRLTDGKEVVMLQLFARGKPLGKGLDGVRAFLDLGHEWVVRGFASITTATIQATEWRRLSD